MNKYDDMPYIPGIEKVIIKQRSTPLKLSVAVQKYVPEEFETQQSNDRRINPFELDGFENPFTKEETIKRIDLGKFDDMGDFVSVVKQLKCFDEDMLKTWWSEDGTKNGALKILKGPRFIKAEQSLKRIMSLYPNSEE